MSSNATVTSDRCGSPRWLLALAALAATLSALLIALALPATSRAGVSQYGVQITDQTSDQDLLDRLNFLGVKRVRMVAGLRGQNPDPDIRRVADNFYVLLTVTEGAGFPARPLTDVQQFKDNLNKQLDALRGRVPLVSVENEMTAEQYYEGEPADYLRELRAAVGPVHNHDAKLSDGGLPSPVAQLVTWNYLWTTTSCPDQGPGPADAYAQATFGSAGYPWPIIQAIPNCQEPNKQLTGTLKDLLDDGNALVYGYTGIAGLDYVNFHWYQSTPDALETTVRVLHEITDKPVITNEIGQWNADQGETLTALLQRTADLQLPFVSWFGSDGGKAIGLFYVDPNKVTHPRASAFAFRDFLAECDDRIDCGAG